MRRISVCLTLALLGGGLLGGLPLPAAAQQRPAAPAATPAPAAGPQRLGAFQDWTAATHQEGGQKVCYAFARASRTEPSRQNVILTVTHRSQGRDQVAITAGYAYPRNAEVEVTVGQTELPFYTANSSAFARDGRAAVAAFRNGAAAVARGPQASGRGQAQDSFPLSGFSAAYDAISRECPAARGR
jgi:invasion protein IalB